MGASGAAGGWPDQKGPGCPASCCRDVRLSKPPSVLFYADLPSKGKEETQTNTEIRSASDLAAEGRVGAGGRLHLPLPWAEQREAGEVCDPRSKPRGSVCVSNRRPDSRRSQGDAAALLVTPLETRTRSRCSPAGQQGPRERRASPHGRPRCPRECPRGPAHSRSPG